MTCTDSTPNAPIPCPGPRDSIWNANQDLVAQLTHDNACAARAQAFVFNKFPDGDWNHHLVTSSRFATYITHEPEFYDGTKSTLLDVYPICGEYSSPDLRRPLGMCNGTTLTVQRRFQDMAADITAMTVTPSYPFKSFWRPTLTSAGADGIDPSSVNGQYGVNITNESNLFHEALHGMTGQRDDAIQTLLGITVQDDSSNISAYIRDNVLSQCSTFVNGSH